ncbi:hypothetical protein KQY30_24330 [Streptomyces sp. GMY02]|uniref:hypothetical protein n=1 Tax=Streptomyces sp. GMY02 TaxID=1333528 RepID=UPI001C2C5F98|nr:hypothetical protein [Streptomyces sp. GMY02]QXE36871.1 hypothetical protein KQY30_24330 [Streptomyces sp. GMY02]
MEVAILILALLFVAFVSLGVYASVKAVGAAKRRVDRTISQARRTVEETTLRARSIGQTGLAGELAQLRMKLRTSIRSTQEALEAGVAEDASLSESVALFQRLGGHARELDDELRQLERDPDRARVAERLPELRERTERITHSADSLRWAARDRARKFAEDDLASLSEQIDMESGALRHWSTADPGPGPAVDPASDAGGAGTARSAGSGGPRTGAQEGAGVPAPESGPGQSASAPAQAPESAPAQSAAGRREAVQEPTQAIEPPKPADPRQRFAYPWQKRTGQARPEATN